MFVEIKNKNLFLFNFHLVIESVLDSITEVDEILEVLVLEYDFAGTRTRTREVSTRTRKSPYSPTSASMEG
jgi:hypothetical protein